MSILKFLLCIRDEHEMLVATLDMWKFRVVTETIGYVDTFSSPIYYKYFLKIHLDIHSCKHLP